MIEDDALHLFITEEIFVVPGKATEPTSETREVERVIEEKETPAPVKAEPTPRPSYTFAVIAQALPESERELLGKILAAVGQDIAAVHLAINPETIDFDYEKLLIFGDSKLTETPSQFYVVDGPGTKILRSKPLHVVAQSRQEKTQLWEALKKWFGIKA